jgi:probable addiction module antidote protein
VPPRKHYLAEPTVAAQYLNRYLPDGDLGSFNTALFNLIGAEYGGVTAVAKAANQRRETLYRKFSKTGNARLRTVNEVLEAMGLCLYVVPLKTNRRKKK